MSMEVSTYDIYAMQLLHYLIVKHDYQIVRVQQHKDDIWLMNANQETYPVLRISSKPNGTAFSDGEYLRNVHRIILNLIHREGPIMIFNTNPESTPIDNVMMRQVKITKDGISDASITSIFPGIDHIVHDVENEQMEMVNISKEIEEAQMKQQKATLARAKKAALPRMTFGFMGIAIFMYLVSFVLTLLTKNAVLAVIASGAYYKMNVVAAYEYFRLLTAGFVHGDIFQLLINLFVFYSVGKSCERMFKRKHYSMIFLTAIVVGNLFVLVAERNTLSLGMSAGIIGILCAYFVILIENGSWRLPMVKFSMMKLGWYGFLLILVSGVPLIGLLGGGVTGVFFGFQLIKGKRVEQVKYHMKIAGGMLLIGLLYLAGNIQHVQPQEKEVDSGLIEVYRHTPMDGYADYLDAQFQKQYEKE